VRVVFSKRARRQLDTAVACGESTAVHRTSSGDEVMRAVKLLLSRSVVGMRADVVSTSRS
jgi:hypothetical protein